MTDEQTNGRTDERTDICDCRVAFATEKSLDFASISWFWTEKIRFLPITNKCAK